MTSPESILAELPGTDDNERLLVVLVRLADGDHRISLRQQSWAEGIGWFDQKSLDLEPDQLNQLRGVLGWTRLTRTRRVDMDERSTIPFPGVSARVVNS